MVHVLIKINKGEEYVLNRKMFSKNIRDEALCHYLLLT